MGNWKYLALSGAMMMGLSAGFVGCGDTEDNTCTEPSDCDSGACDTVCGICIGTACTEDAECTGGQVCRTACADGTAKQCLDPDGAGGSGGSGPMDECDNNVDCYADTAYCADLTPTACVTYECGTMYNDCSQCAKGPDSGAKGTNGPVVFLPEQVEITSATERCRKSPACGDNPAQNNVCRFSASYYAAPGQTVMTGSSTTGQYPYSNIWLVLESATTCTNDGDCTGDNKCKAGVCVSPTFQNVEITADTFSWEGCYDATNLTPGGVVVLLDDAGNVSNSLCFGPGEVP